MNQEMMDPRTGEFQAEIMQPSQLPAAINRADLDVMISTARAYPRDITAVVTKITKLATIDEEAAEESCYALIRGKKSNKGKNSQRDDEENKPIEGPSIRLAEIAAQMYGNCRIEAHVTEVNIAEKWVEAEGIFIDLETNMGSKATVRRSIATRAGAVFSPDMRIVTGNAACAIAKRNAILAGIPRAVYRPAYQAARKMIAGDATTVTTNWDKVVKAFATYAIKPEQLLEHLDLESSADVSPENIAQLRSMYGSLLRKEVTLTELFSPATDKPSDPNYDPLKDAAAKGTKMPEAELDRLFAEGLAAAKAKAERKAPEGYTEEQAKVWLNGFDEPPADAPVESGENVGPKT